MFRNNDGRSNRRLNNDILSQHTFGPVCLICADPIKLHIVIYTYVLDRLK